MRTLHPILPIGPYDWGGDPADEAEFADRLAQVRRVMRAKGWRGLVVFADVMECGLLAYLTHFTPKLGPALALIPAEGATRVVCSGGPRMIPAAEKLTFIADVGTARALGDAIGQWLEEIGGGPLGAVDFGRMPAGVHGAVTASLAGVDVADATPDLRAMARAKSPWELDRIRGACAVLKTAGGVLAETRGEGARAAVLAAEVAAYREGAQDVRALFSLDGGRTLRPFQSDGDGPGDPLVTYQAVKCQGYWAEGFFTLANNPGAEARHATAALETLCGAAAPGVAASDLVRHLDPWPDGLQAHPVLGGSFANGMGVSPAEAPFLSPDSGETLKAGDVLSLKAGALGRGGALVSAMIAIGEEKAEVLFSSAS